METRDEIQTEILSQGSAPVELGGGMQVRPVTFATLLVLRKLGNPLAAALEGRGGAVATDDPEALAEFLWVQCAPWAQVKRLTANVRLQGKEAVDAAVLDWAEMLTPETMQQALGLISGQQEQAAAVAVEVIPDGKQDREKN